MRAEHKALQEKYDKIAAAEAERERIANEKAEKKRKVDTEKATALFETVSALWNDQVRESCVHACCGCGNSCTDTSLCTLSRWTTSCGRTRILVRSRPRK